ncbi:hypothetical protein QNH46_23525 [Paenibacillus woosongensis]|uniref:Uncharacterized protein n=1 Tax=Paenibacillus woosongensis TaxID=307580 RepID=A0AA95I3U2_9BACL|nr:hypothetical protein [Paenibacillus woosongensis]WHX48981.1 hypothetical protein QNH46_23525 [Paenibacillus woosongensis]
MSVYHQMGHDTINLIHEKHLSSYKGAILSPVNYDEEKIIAQITKMRDKANFETIFDPQLYFPRSERGKLRQWSYFPSDVDTAIITEEKWWQSVVRNIVSTCKRINCHSACSPVFAPRKYTNEYYSMMINIGNFFAQEARNINIEPLQTVLVGLNDLSSETRPNHIASIISQADADRIYLVFVSEVIPRKELSDTEELVNAMKLIHILEEAGLNVLVGFCSSDFVLWKAAGASSCATGKFFNLRRFTSSRFEEPKAGGGQLPYWFEENLMAFLRESDLIRVQRNNLISKEFLRNPYSVQILKHMEDTPDKPWLALSWRQYMFAFADLEARINSRAVDVGKLLKEAENNWVTAEEKNILMEEIKNNGEWIRIWRRALIEYLQ